MLNLRAEKRNNILTNLLILAVFIPMFFFVARCSKQNSPNRDDDKLKQLEQLASEIPVCPGFALIAQQTGSKDISVGIFNYYESNVSYEGVKQFYNAELTSRGWRLVNEIGTRRWFRDFGGKKLEYRKNEFLIAIEYAGNAENHWEYGVSFVWRNQY